MARNHPQDRLLQDLLDEAAALAEAGEHAQAEERLAAAQALAPDHPDILYERARWAVLEERLADAQRLLEAAVSRAPEHADARHLLGDLYLQQERFSAAVQQWREVLRLDRVRATGSARGARPTIAFIEGEAERVLDALPEPFASRLADVPVVLEARPHPGLVEEGFDPRALGLFEGPLEVGSEALSLAPTRIVLFWANLVDICDDEDQLAQEVEVTLLHEIGHFFGLDEDGVEALGLA